MMSVGMMHVFYAHMNRQTDRVKMSVLPPMVNRHSEWMKAKTANTFLSVVHVQCGKAAEEELLITHIQRMLDIPLYSDQDRTNNMFFIAVSYCPDLYCARLCYAPRHMNTNHPCAMFLAVNALWDAGKLTAELITHIYCVLVPTCDRSQTLWYNLLTTFIDDLRRILTISTVLLDEEKLAEHLCIVSNQMCCLKNTFYMADWTVDKEDRGLGTRFVGTALNDHTCNTEGGEIRYISEQAAIEVAAEVFHHGQDMSPCRHQANYCTYLH